MLNMYYFCDVYMNILNMQDILVGQDFENLESLLFNQYFCHFQNRSCQN